MLEKKSICLGIFILAILIFTAYYIDKKIEEKRKMEERKIEAIKEEKETIKKIEKAYAAIIKTNKNAKLYKKEKEKIIKVGTVKKDTELELEELKNISAKNKYFKIKNLDYYISYEDVEKIKTLTPINRDFENYIPFNESIVTNKIKLYQEEKVIFDIEGSITSPILINEDDKKYITFNNQLYYVKQEDIKEIIPNQEKQNEIATEMAVLNYHFFYEDNNNNCNQIICISRSAFEKQMQYLTENEYYTVTMKEFEKFLDKKILLPKKSVLITVDDGALGSDTILPQVLEKYNKRATLFLITSFFDYKKFTSPNIELHSHSNNMHNQGVCPGGQGGGIKCLPEEKVLEDLKITKDLLNNPIAFAYPFYEYNTRAMELLKKAGFILAFIGGNKKAKPGINKMLVPRYAVVETTSLNDFIRKVT